jgi:hypothetical protein
VAENWIQLDVGRLVPQEVRDVVTKLSEIATALSDFLSVIRDLLELAKLLAGLLVGNPIEQVLRALIAEVEALLDQLLNQTKGHAILIPIQKVRGDTVLESIDGVQGTPSADERLQDPAFAAPLESEVDQGFFDFVNKASTGIGGNQGFWNTLALSVHDDGDCNRPLFPDNFAVLGGVVIVGSDQLSGLNELIDLLNSLFRLGDMSAGTRPVIQNLRGRPLPISTSAPARIGVILNWDKQFPSFSFGPFSKEIAVVKEIFVIRSEDIAFRQKFSWSEVFSRQPLFKEGSLSASNDLQEENNAKVIARIQYDGVEVGHVDDDPSLVANRAYYYTLCLRYTIDGVPQPMSRFSNTVRVELKRPADCKKGYPPDWVDTPSLAELIPPLEALINQVILALESLLSYTLLDDNPIIQLIKQIERIVQEVQDKVQIIQAILDVIQRLLNTKVGGLYSTTFAVDRGGMDAWLSKLAQLMSDPTDPSKPPFNKGTEYVTGLVAVFGAPNVALLGPTRTLIELFLGKASVKDLLLPGGEDKTLTDAFNAALDKLDTGVAQLEADLDIVFDENLEPTTASALQGPPVPKPYFDENMRPTATSNC